MLLKSPYEKNAEGNIERQETHKGTRDLRMFSWLLDHGPKDIEVLCYVEINKRIPQILQKDNTQ